MSTGSSYVRPVVIVNGVEWPACPTPDCPHGICLWGDTGLCFPCSVIRVGQVEMDRRYEATHE